MKRKVFIASVFLLRSAALWAAPAPGHLGAGVVIGDPVGPTIKYWFDGKHAFDLGVGFDGDTSLWADYLWQGWNLTPQQPTHGEFGGYLGLGGRFVSVDNGDSKLGLRTVGGLNYFFEGYPIEAYVELAPVFNVTPKATADIDGGIGLRVYFATF